MGESTIFLIQGHVCYDESMEHEYFGGIEFGGSKVVCAIAEANGKIKKQTIIPTTTVDETVTQIADFFAKGPSIVSLGVGAFGPLGYDPSSLDYGTMHNTPKKGWENVPIKRLLAEKINAPIKIDLDVNVAALGELHFGVAQEVSNFVYITIGTGIGGSIVMNKQLASGARNPEMGHVRIHHEQFPTSFNGVCMYHGDCLEGIASGPAMEARYGMKPETITNQAVWDMEAYYIATMVANLTLTIELEMIILGGGVMGHEGLLEKIQNQFVKNINGYIDFQDPASYIVASSGQMNGVLGAIKLATLA